MKVTVIAKSWILDDYKGKINFQILTDTLLTRENKKGLMNRICRLIENEIENDEILKNADIKLYNQDRLL